MSQKKSVIFKHLLPVIKQYQQGDLRMKKFLLYSEKNMIPI